MRSQDPRGFTLIEVLVSFSVLLLATGMMVALFIPSMSLFRRQNGKSDSYRSCMMLMEKFRIGVMNSQMETITIANDGQAISWQEIQTTQPFSGTTGDARMSPDFALVFYDVQTEKVYYTLSEGASSHGPDEPSVLTQSDLASARNISSTNSRVLAQNITEFQITDKDGNLSLLEAPLQLTITCQVSTKGKETNDVEAFQLSASVTPRSRRW